MLYFKFTLTACVYWALVTLNVWTYPAGATDHTKQSLRNGEIWKKRKDLPYWASSTLFYVHKSLFVITALPFFSANDRNVFCDGKGIAFLFLSKIKSVFLKSSLTALIVTGFCCFLLRDALVQKKHTETGKNKVVWMLHGWLCFEFVFPLQNKDGVSWLVTC